MFRYLLLLLLVNCSLSHDLPGPECTFDILFMLDTSCSVIRSNRARGLQFFRDLATKLNGHGHVHPAGMRYDNTPHHSFYLNDVDVDDPEAMGAQFDLMEANLDNTDCATRSGRGTRTFDALAKATDYFTVAHGDHPNVTNIIVMAGDSITYPYKFTSQTIANGKALQDNGVKIFFLQLDNKNGNKPDPMELAYPDYLHSIQSQPDYDQALADITSQLIPNTSDCNGGPGDDVVCADVMIAMDTSCSTIEAERQTFINVTKMLLQSQDQSSLHVGFLHFDEGAHLINPLMLLNDPNDAFVDVSSSTSVCSTKTYNMLQFVKDEVFNGQGGDMGGDRPNVRNVLIMGYDGLTAPHHEQSATLAMANLLKANGTDIILIGMNNDREAKNPEKHDWAQTEFDEVPSQALIEGLSYYQNISDTPENITHMINGLWGLDKYKCPSKIF